MPVKKTKATKKSSASRTNGTTTHVHDETQVQGSLGQTVPIFLELSNDPSPYQKRVKALELAVGAHCHAKIEDKDGCITNNEEIVASANAFYTFLAKKDEAPNEQVAGDMPEHPPSLA